MPGGAAPPVRLPLLLAAAARPAAAVRFLAVGDWGTAGKTESDVANAMRQESGSFSKVLALGDNFYPDGVTSKSDKQWKDTFEGPFSGLPQFVAILGNHDYMGDVEAQLGAGGSTAERWSMPARNFTQTYSLDGGGVAELFFVDTNPFCRDYYTGPENRVQAENLKTQDYKVQQAWLDRALGTSSATWKIVVGHHPVHPDSMPSGSRVALPRGYACSMEDTLGSVLKKHAVRLYVSAHWHEQRYYKGSEMDVVISGGGCCVSGNGITADVGDLRPGFTPLGPQDNYEWRNPDAGYLTIEVAAARVTTRFLRYDGALLYTVETLPAGAPPAPAPQCGDTPPDGSATCAEQKSWGKCGKDWMAGYCCATCFACAAGCGGSPAAPPAPDPATPQPLACADAPPDSSATCTEQESWDKCGRDWMKGYCCQTCWKCAPGCGN